MKRMAFLLVAFVLFASGLFAQLEMLSKLPDNPAGAPVFTPGAWVEYKIVDEDKKTSKMKFSILEKENCDSIECFWFEMKMIDEKGEWTIVKFKGANPKKQETIVSLIVQSKGQSPKEMSFLLPKEESGKDMKTKKPKKEPEVKIETEENVSVTVPAGTFITTKYTIKQDKEVTHAYIAENVPIVGLVKGDSVKKKESAELIAYGLEGAKTEITGEVEKIEIPNLQNLLKGAFQPPTE